MQVFAEGLDFFSQERVAFERDVFFENRFGRFAGLFHELQIGEMPHGKVGNSPLLGSGKITRPAKFQVALG